MTTVSTPLLTRIIWLTFLLAKLSTGVSAQEAESEFLRGVGHHFELGVGAKNVWQYDNPRPYFNTLQYSPAFTLPGNRIRVAPMLNVIYPGSDVSVSWGLKTACRVYTGDLNGLGSLYNIHLVAQGWRHQGSFLVGGGLGTEIGQLILVSFKNMYHTDNREFWSLLSFGIVLYPREKKVNDSEHYTLTP